MGQQLLTDRARQVRRTNAEHRLAWLLRSRRLRNYRFERQRSIGPFVVDLLCVERALVIELTDCQHSRGWPSELQRKLLLESLGFRVLSLWDSEVLSDPRAALRKILESL